MPKCIIIAPLYDGCESRLLAPAPGDLVICADAGYLAAKEAGILPDVLIGDFDSMPETCIPHDKPVVRLPVHKDDTDLIVCIRYGREHGYHRFLIAGAIGGRLDHTIAAMQAAKDIALNGDEVTLVDRTNRLRVLVPGEYDLSDQVMPGRHLSLLAASDEVRDICLTGTEWELQHETLTSRYPLGISNEVTGKPVLSFANGVLYLIFSCDRS